MIRNTFPAHADHAYRQMAALRKCVLTGDWIRR